MRHGNLPDNHIPKFKGTEAEYADLVIRSMDHCKARGWNLGKAIIAKLKYNKGRGYKHGGKKA